MEVLTLYQVIQQPVVLGTFFFSFIFLGGSFFLFLYKPLKNKQYWQKREWNERQVSLILTLITSLVSITVSIPIVIQFICSDYDMALAEKDNQFHTGFVCFFISHLILDLGIGSIYYRRYIHLMTGWVHHVFYIILLCRFLQLRITSLFTMSCIFELPTLILAAGSIKRELRSDMLFGITFFILRIVAHGSMTIALKKHHRIQYIWMIALAIYPLHIYWFYGFIRTQLRRFNKRTL